MCAAPSSTICATSPARPRASPKRYKHLRAAVTMAARLCRPQAGAVLRGGTRFLLCTGLLLLLNAPSPASAAGDDTLERIRVLTKGGATQLALNLLDQYQPADDQTESWMQWEKQRYALYRAQRSWAQLAERAARPPAGLPPEFVRWAKTEAARAHLNASDASGARRVLRDLLWRGEGRRGGGGAGGPRGGRGRPAAR